jgi:hypothetical protein
VQAQDPRGARLAVRARTAGLAAADVERSLTHDRSLVVTWLNRGTLHLVRSEDYPWLQALTTPPLHAAVARRLALEGLSPAQTDRAVALIRRWLAGGPLTRLELRERLRRVGVPTDGQTVVHLLFATCVRGVAVRGPMVGREHGYVLVRDWLGRTPRPDPDAALAELARRYLEGHGPATDRDLARWAGIRLGDARSGLSAIAAEVALREDGLVDLAGRPPAAELPPPRLLGAFEPLLLGWASRADVLGPNEATVVSGGIFRPIALVGGRAAGTWRFRAGRVELEPFARLPPSVARALEADSADVARFLNAVLPGP